MRHLKRFNESIKESDLEYVIDILQTYVETKPTIDIRDFLVVISFEFNSKIDKNEIDDINKRLDHATGYTILSFDSYDDTIYFLITESEYWKKIRIEKDVKLIDELDFQPHKLNQYLKTDPVPDLPDHLISNHMHVVYKGISIVSGTGPITNGHRYEIYDGQEAYRFDDDVEANRFFIEVQLSPTDPER